MRMGCEGGDAFIRWTGVLFAGEGELEKERLYFMDC